ncbi:hypothetical protein BN59_03317 [Legionella massiliensis]|uniref:Uncharacterized protein n=1 Tax=Legionella massiliensis TaxID=1034943 RepID=A0A078L198_9GAMM|nr:hypothetical protein [Legionella massiliensis]CDZ79002.1 hypothetical protein BN59_03317 [Legionella massiliensis]CEE14740.1 hypothetical protein BN1094_03317 [Legionella massiliensis]
MINQHHEERGKSAYSALQEWMNMHMKFIENLHYLKAEDFRKTPEKLLELQLKLVAENTAKFQDYLQQSWSLYEKVVTQTNPLMASMLNKIPEASTLNVADSLMGSISNSVFTPTWWGLNPFELAKVFASDMTSDMTSKYPKAQSSTSDNKSKRGTSKRKKE